MLAINKILSCYGLEPLSQLEILDNQVGLSLKMLEDKGKQIYAYVLSTLYYPKSIIYKKDIEMVEHMFCLCGDAVLQGYMNLIKFYSGTVKLDNDTVINFSISINIDFTPITMFNKETGIIGICSANNGEIKLRTIKLPLSSLTDGTILKYSNNPITLLEEILTYSQIRVSNIQPNKNEKPILYIIDEFDATKNFYVLKGHIIGNYMCYIDILLITVNSRCMGCYICKDLLYEKKFYLNDIIMQGRMANILYNSISSEFKKMNISEFIGSCKGFVKTLGEADFKKLITDKEYEIRDNAKRIAKIIDLYF